MRQRGKSSTSIAEAWLNRPATAFWRRSTAPAAPFALRTREARALFRSPAVLAAGGLYGVAFMVQFEGLAHVSVTVAAWRFDIVIPLPTAVVTISGFAKLTGAQIA